MTTERMPWADAVAEDILHRVPQYARRPPPRPDRDPDPDLARLLAMAAEKTRSSLMITDAELDEPGPHIVWVNEAFERVSGYAADEVIGRNPRFLQGPGTDRGVLDLLRAMLESGDDFEGEAINYRADGTPFVMSWRINALRDRHGEITHYVAVQDDVTSARLRQMADRQAIAALQTALLPPLPARVGHFEIGNAYLPAGDGTVGGDWCDIITRDGGAMLAVVGDVTGHGTEAIASMGQLRWATQFAVLGGFSPDATVASLRRLAALQSLHATLLLIDIDPDGRLTYTCAGHPPALIVGQDGAVRELATTTPLIGLATVENEPGPGTDRLAPGDVLVVYTDGLIERRGSGFDVDLAGLRERLPTLDLWAGTAADTASMVIETMCAANPGEDDVAVLVVRSPSAAAAI